MMADKRSEAQGIINMRDWKLVLYLTLNIGLVLVIFSSAFFYVSLSWAAEGSGLRLLTFGILFISAPTLLMIGVVLILFGFTFPVTNLNRLMPFLAIIGFTLPLFIKGLSQTSLILLGLSTGLVLCYFAINEMINRIKGQQNG